MTPPATAPAANNLEAFFMPFTANRQFKKNPRLLARAKGVHYWTPEGRKVIDGTAGLWCVNAGHGREEIKEAIVRQLEEMDYAPVLPDGASQVVRARGAPRRHAAGRPRPRLLLQLRLRGRRLRRSRSRWPGSARAARARAPA